MIKSGIGGKLLCVLRSMYSDVKLCVKHMGNISDLFDSNLGLLQGEVTSPIMFSLFLNDIEVHLQNNLHCGIDINQLSIYLLLFADDAVNTDKTKIIIFRKVDDYVKRIGGTSMVKI